MSGRRPRAALVNEQGIAAPLAIVVLIGLTSLALAFVALSATEAPISTNLRAGEQALALAEGGLERALWALSNATVTGLTDLTDVNAIPATYKEQQALTLSGTSNGVYTIAITPGVTSTITARGYIVRNGVTIAQLADLTEANVVAKRGVQLQVNPVGGPAAPFDVNLPGALTVAGTVQMSGNSLVDGNDAANGVPNTNCHAHGGVTIRDKTTLPDNTVVNNTITVGGSGVTIGTPAQQTLTTDAFNQYLFTDSQLAALKSLAKSQGTYIQPESNDPELHLTLVNGLMFVDTVNGQALGTPPDATKIARVKITGGNNNGWLIVMGSIRIDGDLTYNGFVYAHNDIVYKGTGTGGVYGAMLSANKIDAVQTVIDTDASGNSKIYFDCEKVAAGGGAFTPTVQNALNSPLLVPGSWREVWN